MRESLPDSCNIIPVAASGEHAGALQALLRQHDVLVVCASLGASGADALIGALEETAGRAVIVSHESEVIGAIQNAAPRLTAAGASVVLDAGADPGLPGVLAHLASSRHGAADRIEIFARYRTPQIGPTGLADILDSAGGGARYDRDEWRVSRPLKLRLAVFPGGLGRALAMPVFLPELAAVQSRHQLARMALWHGGINWRADLIVALSTIAGRLLSRDLLLRWLAHAVQRHTPPPHGIGIRAVATGAGRRAEVTVSHNDVYDATAAMAAYAVYCASGVATPGVWFLFELDPEQGWYAALSGCGLTLTAS